MGRIGRESATRGKSGPAHRSEGALPAGGSRSEAPLRADDGARDSDVPTTRDRLLGQLRPAIGGGPVEPPLTTRDRLIQGFVQPKLQSGAAAPSPAAASARVHAPSGGGQPLDHATLGSMESAFGADFSRVRVHTDDHAAASARSLGARAYTSGEDVVLGRGRYAPHSGEGRQLLAHELTHVVQQQQARQSGAALPSGVSRPGDRSEHEADRVSAQAAAGQKVTVSEGPTGGLSRALSPAAQAVVDDFNSKLALVIDPATLDANVHALLAAMAALSAGDLNDVLGAVPVDQLVRLDGMAKPADRATYAAILLSRMRGERVARSTEAMAGQNYWAGPSGPDSASGFRIRTSTTRPNNSGTGGSETNTNDFAMWVRGLGPEPDATSKMNCWEGVLFGAYRAGVLTKARLVSLHATASLVGAISSVATTITGGDAAAARHAGGEGYMNILSNFLHANVAVPIVDNVKEPNRGDVVFFQGLNHVALSVGNRTESGKRKHDIMSLWLLPGSPTASYVSTFQRTTVEQILETAAALGATADVTPVTFAPGPWT